MKGIILAGGSGSRLYPLNIICNKQCLPVADKPMIYYPLSTLMLAGIKDILIISDEKNISNFYNLFGCGERLGINIDYEIQEKPRGIAEAFIIGEDFIEDDNVTLILGDNILYGKIGLDKIINEFDRFNDSDWGAHIFGYHIDNPTDFGVIEISQKDGKVISIEEKPQKPKSNLAIPGIYIYNNEVIEIAKSLGTSDRGELEITDVNKEYLKRNQLTVSILGRGIAWFDTGTHANLLEASNFISIVEKSQGMKIGCLEEIALRKNFINKSELQQNILTMNKSYYRIYLEKVLNE